MFHLLDGVLVQTIKVSRGPSGGQLGQHSMNKLSQQSAAYSGITRMRTNGTQSYRMNNLLPRNLPITALGDQRAV